jgi:hypothetical protein
VGMVIANYQPPISSKQFKKGQSAKLTESLGENLMILIIS